MITILLYSGALILLLVSGLKDKNKTKMSLKVSLGSFSKMLPSVISLMLLIGILLAVLDENAISHIIGSKSGVKGVILALIIGSIAAIPSFVAFPLGGSLLEAGAGYPQIAALVSTLMTIGIVSMPMEIEYFNSKIAWSRLVYSLIISIIFTSIIWVVM